MKAKLYVRESSWDNLHDTLCAHLGIPADFASAYADKHQVRDGHAEAGKYIMPIVTEGVYKVDQLVSGEVNWDDDWFEQEEPE